MKKELVFGLVVVLFLVNLSFVKAECGSSNTDIQLMYDGTENCDNFYGVRLYDSSPDGTFFEDYTNVTLESDTPESIKITTTSRSIDKSSNEISWVVDATCPTSQDVILTATLSGGSDPSCTEETFSLAFASSGTPDLSMAITGPSSMVIDSSEDFTITVTNTGDGDSEGLTGSLSSDKDYSSFPTGFTTDPVPASDSKTATISVTANTVGTETITTSITSPSLTASTTFLIEGFSITCKDITMTKNTDLTYDFDSNCKTTEEFITWDSSENADITKAVAANVATFTPTADWTGTTNLTITATSASDTATDDITITIPTPAIDVDTDGYSPPEDCKDGNKFINPGANETCGNSEDDDCDGLYDEDFDQDSDGYTTCGTLTGSGSSVTADCNDTNEYMFPDNSNLYCDCDDTNITKSKKESIMNGECEDNIDNDCDDDIDEDDEDCNPCNIFTELGSFPSVTITSPTERTFSTKDSIDFIADVDDIDSIDRGKVLWEFGDEGMAYTLETNYSYKIAGDYTVKISIRDNKDCHTSDDTVQLTIGECFTKEDCNGLCCNSKCKTPECTVDADCNQNNPLITDEKCEDQGCNAYCKWGNCTISCKTDIDCNDQDDTTIDKCTTPGTCGSRCINSKKDLEISIISPEDKTYDTNEIPFEYSTNIPVRCEYQVNKGNRQRLYANSFNINARAGKNTLTLFCSGKTKEVSFTVKGDASLMGDLTSEKEEDTKFLDFLKKKKPLIKVTEEEITTLLGSIIKDEGAGYELDRELSQTGNQSTVKLGLKNIKSFLALKNVELTVTIPKTIIENASLIKSSKKYTIIESDPVIKHSFSNIDSGNPETISYTFDKELSQDLLNQILVDVQSEEITEEQITDIKEKIENTQEATEITKKITKEDGKTTITTTIIPKGVLKDTKVFLEIPKCMAEKVNEIAFKDKNFQVISDDPLIVWQFSELSSKIDLTYEIGKDIDIEDCEKESVILALAEQIENMDNGSPSSSYWKIILASLLVPIVGFGVVYFQKFGGKNEMEEFIDKTAETIKQDIARGYYKDQTALNQLKLNLYKNGWDVNSIETLFDKLKK